MANLHTLNILLERETEKRDALQTALREAIQRAEAAQRQADALLQYRAEYQKRWATQFSQSATVEILRCYQDFSQRLVEAIDQQQRVARHVAGQVEQARAVLTAQEIRVASVKKLIERRVLEAQRAAERRDQKQTDEAAMRSAMRRAADSELELVSQD